MVAHTYYATVGGFSNAGAAYFWRGGPTLAGGVTESAAFTAPAPAQSDELGNLGGGQPVLLADVTADGVLDVLVAGMYESVAATESGGVYLLKGGAGLAGTPATAAATYSGKAVGEHLGQAK